MCVCKDGVTEVLPTPPNDCDQGPMSSVCMQVCMCAMMCLSQVQCASMSVSVACVYDVMHIWRNKYMHANLSARLHVHVTLEWLLQLQRMGVYLVDSGEGPNGPRR